MQTFATIIPMTSNSLLNDALAYRDQRPNGSAGWLTKGPIAFLFDLPVRYV